MAEFCPAPGACQVVWGPKSVRLQGHVQVPGFQKFVLHQGHAQCADGRIVSSVRGMSSVRVAELRPASGYVQRPGKGWQNSDLRQGMSSGQLVEICPASGVCPVPGWHNSVLPQRPSGITPSGSRGMSRGRVAEIYPAPVACSVGEWKEIITYNAP
ncbi:hypothetical protein TNCV_627361 [Trichonephila clavipes]|nr:hypothetical protein TNCV_627361 [Trichonephila clavipes]